MNQKATIQASIIYREAKKNFPTLSNEKIKTNCLNALQKEKDHLDDVEFELRKL